METLETLLHLAKSSDFSQRARAGTGLSLLAGSAAVDQVLAELLVDDENTLVTQETAEALIARGDAAALRPFATAWHLAESRTGDSHLAEIGDHLRSAISFGLWLDSTDPRRTGLRAVVGTLLDDQDRAVRKGAESLLGLLDGTRPAPPGLLRRSDRGADYPDRSGNHRAP